MIEQQIERRVTASELCALLSITPEWLRRLERDGRIPPCHRDPGSRRKWWPASVAAQIVAGRIEPQDAAGKAHPQANAAA